MIKKNFSILFKKYIFICICCFLASLFIFGLGKLFSDFREANQAEAFLYPLVTHYSEVNSATLNKMFALMQQEKYQHGPSLPFEVISDLSESNLPSGYSYEFVSLASGSAIFFSSSGKATGWTSLDGNVGGDIALKSLLEGNSRYPVFRKTHYSEDRAVFFGFPNPKEPVGAIGVRWTKGSD